MSNGKFINLWVGQEAPPNISDLWLYPSNSGYQFRKFNRNTAQWVTSASQTVSAAEDMPAIGKVLLNTGKCLSAGAAASFLEYCKERNLGVEAVGIITGTSLPSSSEVSVSLDDLTIETNSVTLGDKMYYVIAGGLTRSFNGTTINSLATASGVNNWNNIVGIDANSFLLLVGLSAGGQTQSKKVFSYSISSNSYTEKADNGFSNPRKLPIKINNSIYAIASGTSSNSSELGIYNSSINTWTTGKTLLKQSSQVFLKVDDSNSLYLITLTNQGLGELIKYDLVSQTYSIVKSNILGVSPWMGCCTNLSKIYLASDQASDRKLIINELISDLNFAKLLETTQNRPVIGVINTDMYFLSRYDLAVEKGWVNKTYKITPGSYEISPYNPETN